MVTTSNRSMPLIRRDPLFQITHTDDTQGDGQKMIGLINYFTTSMQNSRLPIPTAAPNFISSSQQAKRMGSENRVLRQRRGEVADQDSPVMASSTQNVAGW